MSLLFLSFIVYFIGRNITKDKIENVTKDKTVGVTKDKTVDVTKDKTVDVTKDKTENIQKINTLENDSIVQIKGVPDVIEYKVGEFVVKGVKTYNWGNLIFDTAVIDIGNVQMEVIIPESAHITKNKVINVRYFKFAGSNFYRLEYIDDGGEENSLN